MRTEKFRCNSVATEFGQIRLYGPPKANGLFGIFLSRSRPTRSDHFGRSRDHSAIFNPDIMDELECDAVSVTTGHGGHVHPHRFPDMAVRVG